jgi:hypothetical protein
MEIWKPIPNFGSHYEASDLGNIRVKDRIIKKRIFKKNFEIGEQLYKGKILKQSTNKRGYKSVSIGYDNKTMTPRVGRLILMAFKGLPKDGEFCCHNNNDPSDNRIENLRWGDQKDNMRDRTARGKYFKGEDHVMSKLSNDQIREIRNLNELNSVLAKRYGVDNSTIGRIKKNKTWKHVID